jgi:hypothetical protein
MKIRVHVYPIFRCEIDVGATIPDDANPEAKAEIVRAIVTDAEGRAMTALTEVGSRFQVDGIEFSYADECDDSLVDELNEKTGILEKYYTVGPRRTQAQEHAKALAGIIDHYPGWSDKILAPIKQFLETL